jgi:hypothetical protein
MQGEFTQRQWVRFSNDIFVYSHDITLENSPSKASSMLKQILN